MTTYKVRMHRLAVLDMDALYEFLTTVMSKEGANRYIDAMIAEVNSLSIFADLYRPSRYADIRCYHPRACRMVSHNKRWVYVFHLETDMVIVDRILPSKMIKK